jgi:hypothetical protein
MLDVLRSQWGVSTLCNPFDAEADYDDGHTIICRG